MTSSRDAFKQANRDRDRAMGIGIVDDPYPTYHRLQATCPVHEGTISGAFGFEGPDGQLYPGRRHVTATTFEHVEAVLKDTDAFSSAWYDPQLVPSIGRSILHMDPPEHLRHRFAVQRAFSRMEMRWWESEYVIPACDQYIDEFIDRGSADLYSEYCMRVPIHVIALALGLPTDDLPWFHANAVKLTTGGTRPADAAAATQEMEGMLRPLIDERRTRPGRDLVSVLCDARIDEDGGRSRPLDESEILTFCKLLLPAGANTTYRSLGLLLTVLFRDVERLERVRRERSLIPACVEELLRLEHSTSLVGRVCTRETTIGDVTLEPGDIMLVSLAAANHDATRWEAPDEFDIDRPRIPNIAFGWGRHLCLGVHLARMELRVALERLLDRLPGLRPDPSVALAPISGVMFRAPEHVRAVWDLTSTSR